MSVRKGRWSRGRPLRRGVPVLAILDDDELDPAGAFYRRLDDAEWRSRLARPFTWQTWTDWHACRRWIAPDGVPQLEVDRLAAVLRVNT